MSLEQTTNKEEIGSVETYTMSCEEVWKKMDEMHDAINGCRDKLIRIEMYFENFQEYINKHGGLPKYDKSDEGK